MLGHAMPCRSLAFRRLAPPLLCHSELCLCRAAHRYALPLLCCSRPCQAYPQLCIAELCLRVARLCHSAALPCLRTATRCRSIAKRCNAEPPLRSAKLFHCFAPNCLALPWRFSAQHCYASAGLCNASLCHSLANRCVSIAMPVGAPLCYCFAFAKPLPCDALRSRVSPFISSALLPCASALRGNACLLRCKASRGRASPKHRVAVPQLFNSTLCVSAASLCVPKRFCGDACRCFAHP